MICLNSEDFSIASLGLAWLQGQELEPAERKALGFLASSRKPIDIVEALSWCMSLSGPTVLAFDQLDAIIAQHNAAERSVPDTEEQSTSWSIIQQIGAGMGSIRDRTFNTLPVVSCLEATWLILEKMIPSPFLDRFEEPQKIEAIKDSTIAEGLVRNRLAQAFDACRFAPPYPTWPFRPTAFQGLATNTPREILKLCEHHRRAWLTTGTVIEVARLGDAGGPAEGSPTEDRFRELDHRFEALRSQADPASLLEEKHEDERLAPLLQTALRCLVHESSLPRPIGAAVDSEFTGGDKTRPLHVRLRLIFQDENEREEHYCLRALQLSNARAYQARLKAAMTQSGIDRALKFRRLGIVRTNPVPQGPESQKLTGRFELAGGLLLNPSEDDLRTLWALACLKQAGDPDLDAWLQARRPVSQLSLIRAAVPSPLFFPSDQPEVPSNPEVTSPCHTSQPDPTAAPGPRSAERSELPVGRRLGGGRLGETLNLPIRLLEKHTVILAGAGSGKTVLVKRLIEEAAILGVPSIVIDGANDLVTLDEPWPNTPAGRTPEDEDRARQYHASRQVVVWTPGKESGNPLALEPLPDLAAISQDEDELGAAIAMVRETLDPIVAPGQSLAAQHKQGILSKALRFFACQPNGTLQDLIALLEDLPPEASLGVHHEPKLARQMADALKVAREKNPLLRSSGTPLDPAVLLGDDRPSDRTRISVINLIGLPTLESQRLFLAQLAMTLFGWIKKHPNPAGRPLCGLLVIDEARDYVPAQRGSACKEALIRLAAQARKYHLGLIFATQNPKDIDNKVIANCSTHFYGKVNSPASIDVVRDQIRLRGGEGDDIAKLPRGQFYVHNADLGLTAPVKIAVPLCLSCHPEHPLDDGQILSKARKNALPA